MKYGILPEKLQTAELPAGNALVEGATFLAILIGTIAGGIAVAEAKSAEHRRCRHPGAGGRVLAVRAHHSRRRAAAPDLVITRNPWTSTVALLREMQQGDPRLWGGAHIVSWFWLVGSVALSLLPAAGQGQHRRHRGRGDAGLAAFTVGIAVGSVLAARASHGKPNLALVPLGAILMGLFCAGARWPGSRMIVAGRRADRSARRCCSSGAGLALLAALCGLAIAGGLYIVPSFAAVQAWAPPERRARVIAAVNVLNAAYMVAAAPSSPGCRPPASALARCLPCSACSASPRWPMWCAPGARRMRDVGRMIFAFFFSLEVKGLENLPAAGERVIIAPNHVSLLDGPLLHSVLPGMPRSPSTGRSPRAGG